ncbi:hypothetical protein CTAYLR_006331 [Chrysophaeum taylorii]|uniref:serine O-acetyltransferase n=1 Tax=Chrysophaeum taylorii TaxID=2483200 RepID=A0AAD7UA12_9STRA|nr:hypothetical protein CTAYLR_006331 [Chrysophaeum taylorii]
MRLARRLLTTDVSASALGATMLSELSWRERDDMLWKRLVSEGEALADDELLGSWMRLTVLGSKSQSFSECIAKIVSRKMSRDVADTRMPLAALERLMVEALADDPRPGADVVASMSRDPAAISYLQCCMFFKGFHAVQAHRAAAKLWRSGGGPADTQTALALQDRVLELWDVDVHPGAEIGGGIMMDHATAVVVGETAVVGEDCTMLHGVTLGGRGGERADRHPKVGDRVTLGAGCTVIGPVTVGDDASIGSQAVVTRDVPAGLTVVGQNKLLNPFLSRARKEEIKRRQFTWQYEVASEA